MPFRITHFVGVRGSDDVSEALFTDAKPEVVLLPRDERHAVGSARANEAQLREVIFPIADGANIIGAGWFGKNNIPTTRAGIFAGIVGWFFAGMFLNHFCLPVRLMKKRDDAHFLNRARSAACLRPLFLSEEFIACVRPTFRLARSRNRANPGSARLG